MKIEIPTGMERRHAVGRPCVRLSEDRRIRGTAIVFDSLSLDLGGFREVIRASAVDRTLKARADVRALWNHDTGEVLGRTTAGTLALKKTRGGLDIKLDPPRWASHRMESIERGDVTGMSFRFRVPPNGDRWHTSKDDLPLREVIDMEFDEVSIVTFPAYPDTDVALRSLLTLNQSAIVVPTTSSRWAHGNLGIAQRRLWLALNR